jgi:hypothetical protein
MRACYNRHQASAPRGVFVAIELLSEKDAEGRVIDYVLPGEIEAGLSLEYTVPGRVPQGSVFLGYDVANTARISALSNAEYTEQELRESAPVWAPHLNSVGLFETVDDALAFRLVCDRRVPGEAPFWIYALWRLVVE